MMLNKYLWTLLSIFFIGSSFFNTHAQSPIVIQGYMGVEGGELFNYKMELFPKGPQRWEGYSYTYEHANKDVKATVTVQIKEDSIMHVQEHRLLYNHGFKSKATICLLNAELIVNKDFSQIKGPIITITDLLQSQCSSGTLTFVNDRQIAQFFKTKTEEIATNTPAAKTTKPANTAAAQQKQQALRSQQADAKLHQHFRTKAQKDEFEAQKLKRQQEREAAQKPIQEEITQGKKIEIIVKEDTVAFFVWDGGKIDYDKVSVYVNDKLVLDDYTLTAQPKKIDIPITQKNTSIKILALNEGNEPPNTADITIKDGKDLHHILSYNNRNRHSEILLIKK